MKINHKYFNSVCGFLLFWPVYREMGLTFPLFFGIRYKNDDRITRLGLKAIEAIYFHAENLIQNGEWDLVIDTLNICSHEEQR